MTRIIMLVWTTIIFGLASLVATTNSSSNMRQSCSAAPFSSPYLAVNTCSDSEREELLGAIMTTTANMCEMSEHVPKSGALSKEEEQQNEHHSPIHKNQNASNTESNRGGELIVEQAARSSAEEEMGQAVVKNDRHHHYHHHNQKGISVISFFRRKTHQLKKLTSAIFRYMGRIGNRFLVLRRDSRSSRSSSISSMSNMSISRDNMDGNSNGDSLPTSDNGSAPTMADSAADDSISPVKTSRSSSSGSGATTDMMPNQQEENGVSPSFRTDKQNAASDADASNARSRDNSGGSGSSSSVSLDDDIISLNLSPVQLKAVLASYSALTNREDGIVQKAAETHFPITQHLVYRYLASEEWHEIDKPELVQQAIVDTINWRSDFGIHKIHTIGNDSSDNSVDSDDHSRNNFNSPLPSPSSSFVELVRGRRAFTQDDPDKKGRCLTYIRMPATIEKDKLSTYLKLVMYTVERADKCSVQCGAGQSVVIIDMSQFAWSMNMPIGYMKEVFQLLSVHYRLRLSKLYILNAGRGFYMAWKAVSGILPASTLAKTEVFGSVNEEVLQKLDTEVGLENIDETFGGKRKFNVTEWEDNTDQYFSRGYWGQQEQQ